MSDEKKEISPQLLEQVKALKLLTRLHNILMGTSHPVREFQNVAECMSYVLNLHDQLASEIILHPDVERIPEMAPILEQKKKDKAAEDVNVASNLG